MDLFPDIEQAVPLPHEEVLRYIVRKIRNNLSEKWLVDTCRKHNLYDVYQDYLLRGVVKNLEGEPDFSFYPPRLTIELVPRSCWFINVRSAVSASDWARLRKDTARKAGWQCQICGGKGPKWPVECHEIWHYDDENQCQTLTGLISLCPSCHEVKHMGLSELRGKKEEAVAHLALVNGWALDGAFDYVDEAFELWIKRSEHAWKLDISWLKERGISLKYESVEKDDIGPEANQLSLKLEYLPPASDEKLLIVDDNVGLAVPVEQNHNDALIVNQTSIYEKYWKSCLALFSRMKKVVKNQW
ncbi:hypothetical protein AAFL49_10080 [Klebsiella michiganensis]|uniref:HNH endonuclease n=1 Tax=Klebsiella michiganensis TaxID=1134687 RepID=UPI00315FACDA